MKNRTPNLEICLLGAPEIQISGKPLPLNHLKARALLFFLAASRQAHTRQYLSTLLRGESAFSEALHSLRSSLYRLPRPLAFHPMDCRQRRPSDLSRIAQLAFHNHTVQSNPKPITAASQIEELLHEAW